MDITELTVHELQEKLKSKELTIKDITKAYTDRIAEKEKDLNKVLIGTIGAMGTGLTLTAASNVIFIDEPWNKALKDQCSDRCHRIGANETVFIRTLICKNTLDEKINAIVKSKGALADMLIDGVPRDYEVFINYLFDL